MDYQEYLKNVLTSEEIQRLNNCYNQDNIVGLRTNLLKSNPDFLFD